MGVVPFAWTDLAKIIINIIIGFAFNPSPFPSKYLHSTNGFTYHHLNGYKSTNRWFFYFLPMLDVRVRCLDPPSQFTRLHKVPLNILVIIVNLYNRCYVMLFYIHIIIFRIYIYAHNFNSIWINVSGISEVTVTKFIIRDTTRHKFTVRVFKLHHKVTAFAYI